MTRRKASGARKSTKSTLKNARFALDPYFACLIFAGVGLATLGLNTSPRLIILWMTLLGLWLAYRERQEIRLFYQFEDMGRGLGIGLAVGIPLLLLAFRPLATAIPILYVNIDRPPSSGPESTMIFVSLVLLAPLAEELFFRDILQRERGFWIATALYAAAGVIFFLPTAGQFLIVLVAVSGASAMLGAVYGYLHERAGLTTTIACHLAVNLMLIFVPSILSQLDLLTR